MHCETIINKNYPGVNPMFFGYQICPKAYGYGPATRLNWVFHFVVSGKGFFQINNKKKIYTLIKKKNMKNSMENYLKNK